MLAESVEEDLFQHLYQSFHSKVYQVAMSITRDAFLAEDVLQETFMKIFHHLDQLSNVERINAWIQTITTRTAIDLLRKEKRNPTYEVNEMVLYDETFHLTTEEEVEALLLKEQIEEQLATLKPDYRQILELKYKQGLKEKEIEKVLNVSKSAVKTRLHRARKALKEKVSM